MTETRDKAGRILRRYTVREGREIFDREARAKLGISAAEFVRRWRAGAYDGPEADTPEVTALAIFLPAYRAQRKRPSRSR